MSNHTILDILSVYWIIVIIDLGILMYFVRTANRSD